MTDALHAAGSLFRAIPLKVRRTVYGLYGLVILVEPIVDVLPEDVDLKVIAGFGLFNTLMALANSSATPVSEADDSPLVDPKFPDEFA